MTNPVQNVVDHIGDKLVDVLSVLRPNKPEYLFHYTDTAGLLGIIKDGAIRATDFRYLNDFSESTYAWKVVEEVVLEKERAYSNDRVICDFLGGISRLADPFQLYDLYVACFCENGDLLSQWRAYAGAECGFSLGFQASHLGDIISGPHPRNGAELRRVIYNRDEQRALIGGILDLSILALLDTNPKTSPHSGDGRVPFCWDFTSTNFADCLPCFKDESFSEEREWRLCHFTDYANESHVEYRAGRYGPTPYVEVHPCPIGRTKQQRLSLAKVIHATTDHPATVQQGLAKLLRKHGLDSVHIVGSKIPLRPRV